VLGLFGQQWEVKERDMGDVRVEEQEDVRVVSRSDDEIMLAVRMTFPRRGMANMLDSWRNWLDQGKSAGGRPYLGVQISVDAVMRALASAEAGSDKD
jgi:hypothetical protein